MDVQPPNLRQLCDVVMSIWAKISKGKEGVQHGTIKMGGYHIEEYKRCKNGE